MPEIESQQPPQPETSKKDNVLLRVLIAGCGCLVIIGILFVLFFGKILGFARGPTHVVESQLKAINSEDYDAAYNQFSHTYREKTSVEQFRQEIRHFSPLLPYKRISLGAVKVQNEKAIVDGTITGKDSSIFAVHYDLIRENGRWKIVNFEWSSPGERQTI